MQPSKPSKYQHRFSSFQMRFGATGSWRIGYGHSSFLVAEGSGWSAPLGRALMLALEGRIYPPRPRVRKRGVL